MGGDRPTLSLLAGVALAGGFVVLMTTILQNRERAFAEPATAHHFTKSSKEDGLVQERSDDPLSLTEEHLSMRSKKKATTAPVDPALILKDLKAAVPKAHHSLSPHQILTDLKHAAPKEHRILEDLREATIFSDTEITVQTEPVPAVEPAPTPVGSGSAAPTPVGSGSAPLDPGQLMKRLEGGAEGGDSKRLDKMISKAGGSAESEPPFDVDDASIDPVSKEYRLGHGRRRIGAGFARRRRTPAPPADYPAEAMGSAVEPGIEATGSAAGLRGYSAFKFTPTKLRNNKANSVQVAELRFQHNGAAVDVSDCPTVNPGGHNPTNEEPPKGDDGDTHTKWLDFNKGSLVVECNSPKTVDKWTWVTANDNPDRDPVQWTLEGATSGIGPWFPLGEQADGDFATPTARFTALPWFDMPSQLDMALAPPAPPTGSVSPLQAEGSGDGDAEGSGDGDAEGSGDGDGSSALPAPTTAGEVDAAFSEMFQALQGEVEAASTQQEIKVLMQLSDDAMMQMATPMACSVHAAYRFAKDRYPQQLEMLKALPVWKKHAKQLDDLAHCFEKKMVHGKCQCVMKFMPVMSYASELIQPLQTMKQFMNPKDVQLLQIATNKCTAA